MLLDSLVLMEELAQLGHEDYLVDLEDPDLREPLDSLDHLAFNSALVSQDCLDSLDPEDLRAHKDHLDPEVSLEHKEQLVSLEHLEELDLLVLLD